MRLVCRFSGIIPANTGRMSPMILRKVAGWDHPREYGENFKGDLKVEESKGSSPRIRGKLLCLCLPSRGRRIIPANTGKMPIVCGEPSHLGDHPREYGENQRAGFRWVAEWGSSPRIRGKSRQINLQLTRGGIIPANTGKIASAACFQAAGPDHPREYGENRPPESCTLFCDGSSPRIRGK